jgi:adenylate kinase family enzyme
MGRLRALDFSGCAGLCPPFELRWARIPPGGPHRNSEDISMNTANLKPNTMFIEVSGSGLPEVDGLFVPSVAPPAESESGTVSSPGYWNGKMAWDRADGKCDRSPALSYSNSYRSWRICRLDGHLAYDITCDDAVPPVDREWHVYKKGVAPAPTVVVHHFDPREPLPKPNVVFVLGGPGSGKGTMCSLAEAQLGWVHLSAGELLRAERKAGGATAGIIEKHLAAGEIVPNSITVTLLKKAMEQATRTTGKLNFLIDGFPRSLGNLEGWYESFGREADLPKMLYFECPYDVLEQRILGRAKYSGRSDDNIESVKLRFDTFKAKTLPTLEVFKSLDKVAMIDASQGREEVYAVVIDKLGAHTDPELAAQPLTEHSEILLGLRPYPPRK